MTIKEGTPVETYVVAEKSRQNGIMLVVCASIFMFTLDFSMFNISLPNISNHLSKDAFLTVAQLPMAFILVVTSTLLGFGKLGDIKGYKKIFILGLVIYVAGTFLSSLAPTLYILLFTRVIQAVGESMFSPTGIAIFTTLLPAESRGKALGLLATAQGLGLSVGPAVGGFINTHIGWRAIFYLNIPIGILTILLAMKWLPSRQPEPADARFDTPGAILIFFMLAPLLYALNSGTKMGWTDPVILVCLAASLIALPLFLIREKRIPYPLVDLRLFKDRDFSFAASSSFLAMCCYIGIGFLLPFYLTFVLKMDFARVGLLMMIPSVMTMILGPLAGQWSDRMGSRGLCTAGLTLVVAAFTLFFTMNSSTGVSFIMGSLLVLGTGLGLFMAPNNKLVMMHVPADKQGVGSGIYKIMLKAGSVVGLAVFPLVFIQVTLPVALERYGGNLRLIRGDLDLMTAGFRSAFVAGIILSLAAFAITLLARDVRRPGAEK
jgi:EmrB/QacA subfamily drug resistance transporter